MGHRGSWSDDERRPGSDGAQRAALQTVCHRPTRGPIQYGRRASNARSAGRMAPIADRSTRETTEHAGIGDWRQAPMARAGAAPNGPAGVSTGYL